MRRFAVLSAALLVSATTAIAQGMTMAAPPAGKLSIAASPRAMAVLSISTGVRGATPLKVTVDYGQPFARGRVVEGTLIPSAEVWRTGANAATSLVTDVDLRIGSVTVPKGSYTLYSIWSPSAGMQLIINKQTGQWGTEYKKEMDLGRVAMTARTLSETRDAFVIALEPAAANATGGTLRMSWGKSEFSAPFTIAQ